MMMKIKYFLKSKTDPGVSINNVFLPIIEGIKKHDDVEVDYLPCIGLSIKSIIKNILYVFKKRDPYGVNQIVGEVHYVLLGLIGVKSVITVHDIGFLYDKKLSLAKRIFLYVLLIVPLLIANKIVVISEFTHKDLVKYLPFVKNKVHLIPTVAIDACAYSPKTFDKSNITILQNGTRPHKNLETTLKAIQGLDYKLIVVREMTPSQIQLAKELNINYVNYFNLSYEEVIKTYQQSDIVIFPTLYEGFGVITIEAQAIGRPVITTNREPMKSVAGGAALLLDNPMNPEEIRQKIQELVENDNVREFLIEKGLANAENYKGNYAVEKYKNLYDRILNTKAYEKK